MTGHRVAARTGTLTLAALGVVFGDIGTSPLYAFRESFESSDGRLVVDEAAALGIVSLILWSLLIIISTKYLVFVMRADADGEGGILALTTLATRADDDGTQRPVRTVAFLSAIGLFGTALLYGDGMITPAISVLSAVEGTELAVSGIDRFVVPISIVILVGLFAIQSRGTGTIGKVFGPVMVVWFTVLAGLGIRQIAMEPAVLRAVSPTYAVGFLLDNGFGAFLALGSVFLVVTGGEALYADMGHFGKRPITVAWYGLVLPGLVLNYFGQAALLVRDPEAIDNPFFRLAPSWGVLPLVVLSTGATVIASQALISGAFSLTMQATQLGFSPRTRIIHTSESEAGQVYVPAVNWGLMVACVGLVIGFGSSSALAAAYGVAVTTTMVITTILLWYVLRHRFGWSTSTASALCLAFGVVDLGFFGANVLKIPAGGWFPLVVGLAVFTAMTTWRTGRQLVGARIRSGEVPLTTFLDSLADHDDDVARVAGTAVYLYSNPGMTPPALIANVRHNRVLHEDLVVASIRFVGAPRVLPGRRTEVTDVGMGVRQIVVSYGFMEQPDLPLALGEGPSRREHLDVDRATWFLGTESIVVTDRPGMARWREHLFGLLNRNARSAADYFGLPADRTVSLGSRVDI